MEEQGSDRIISMLKVAVVLIPGLFVLFYIIFRDLVENPELKIFTGVTLGVLIGIGILDLLDRFGVVDVWSRVW